MIYNKINFKLELFNRNKEGFFILIKGIIYLYIRYYNLSLYGYILYIGYGYILFYEINIKVVIEGKDIILFLLRNRLF